MALQGVMQSADAIKERNSAARQGSTDYKKGSYPKAFDFVATFQGSIFSDPLTK